jgi:hypothetical protein
VLGVIDSSTSRPSTSNRNTTSRRDSHSISSNGHGNNTNAKKLDLHRDGALSGFGAHRFC